MLKTIIFSVAFVAYVALTVSATSKRPCCKANEVYSKCVNQCCNGPKTCEEVGKVERKCVKINPKYCIKGCKCIDGYVKDENGACINKDQCPKQRCDENGDGDNSEEDDDGYKHNDTSNSNSDEDQKQFSKGIAKFSSRFIKETANTQKNDNVVMSPFSVLIPLAELALYTIGKSLNQLLQAIGLQKKSQIRDVYKRYLDGTKNQENITFNLAAMVYLNEKYEMTDAFSKDTATVFGAGAETIDVDQPTKAANTINTWVESKTNNKIKNLVSPSMITPDTRLVLVNAVYFKGKWKKPFDPKLTAKLDFYVTANNIQQTDTMFIDTNVEYTKNEELDCKIIRLPYKNEKFSAVFILPNKIDGIDDLLNKMQDLDKTNTALQSLTTQKVKIWLPKFTITTTIDLNLILQKLGITDIFTNQSGLTGILKSNEPLKVDRAIQKCFIEVNEEGTEAAAANAFTMTTTSVQLDPPEFRANHPFVFLLSYKGDTIFNGVYRKPSTK